MNKSFRRPALCLFLAVLILGFVPVAAGAVATRLTTGATDQFQPAINGNNVVWLDGVDDIYGGALYSDVYLMPLGGSAQKLTTVKKAHAPAISNTKVVWEDLRNYIPPSPAAANSDIYGYSLPAGPESLVDMDAAPQLAPAVSGSLVVWQAFKNGQWDIFLKKTDGSIVQITNDAAIQRLPRIDGDKIVWQDNRNGNEDIYLFNITSAVETRITANSGNQTEPDISGNLIVWTDARVAAAKNIYLYDLSSPVANGTAVNANAFTQHGARISGNRIVWTDWRNGNYVGGVNSDIYTHDLATGKTSQVTSDINNQNSASTSGDTIVWADNRNGNWDIYTGDDYTVGSDAIAPTAAVTAPALSSTKSKTLAFKVFWSGTDPAPSSGIVSYGVQYKIGAGSAWTNWKTGVTVTSANLTGKGGKTYYFRARAKDGQGNVGPWSAKRKTIVPFDGSKHVLSRRGFGKTYANSASNFYRGTVRYSTRRKDYIVYRFTGDSFGFISTKAKGRSKFKVYVDGKYKGTYDTYSSRIRYRRQVYSISWAGLGVHRVRIVNLATAGRRRLDADGIAVGN